MAIANNGVTDIEYQFDMSFVIDLIDVDSDPRTINDLFIDFLNSFQGIRGYRFVIHKCACKRVKGGALDGESKKDAS